MYRCLRLGLLASLCVSAACGSVKDSAGHLPDAATQMDAAVTPVRGTVHVTVLEPGGTGNPAVGATVVFVDADGTVSKKATDTAGKADAELLPGASATSIVLVNTQYTLQTVMALKPNDDITLGTKSVDTALNGTFQITVPTYTDPNTKTNAASYEVSTPCGAFTITAGVGIPNTAQTNFYNNCKKTPFELVVVALDSLGAPLASIDVPSVSYLANQAYTVSGPYTSLQNVTASYTNIDPVITNLQAARISPDAAGVSFGPPGVAPSGTAIAFTMSGGVSTKAQMLTGASKGALTVQVVRQPLAGTASTYGLDLAATLLPWIGLPTYDASTTKLTVPTDTTGTTKDKPDLFETGIRFSRTDANQVTTTVSWSFFEPDIADISLPALPSDFASLIPTANDTVAVTVATAFEAASVDGYDAVKNNTMAAFSTYTNARPPDANIRLTRYTILIRK